MEIVVILQHGRITESDLLTLRQCHNGDEISQESDYDKETCYCQSTQNVICIKDVYYSGALYT